MTQDNVSPRDIARSLPGILRRFPAIAKGYYYYSVKNENKDLTLGTLVDRNAEKYGHRPAILFEDRSITWREFNGWANRIAGFLKTEGLIRGDTIAVFLENRPELLAVVAGAAKVGVACAMLNTSQKGRVLEHSINLVSPKMVVVGEELVEAFDGVKADIRTSHPNPFLFLADTNTMNIFGDAPEGYVNMAAKVSAQIEQIVLDSRQGRVRLSGGGQARHADKAVQLVDRAVGVDPDVVLGHPRAVAQCGIALVAGAGVNLV